MRNYWKTATLGDVATVALSGVDKHILPGETPVRLCNYLDVYRNRRITKPHEFSEGSARPSEVERFQIQKGDVIITKDSETPDDIAVPCLIADDFSETICGYHLALIRPGERLDSGFLSYLFQSDAAKRYFLGTATGLTRFGLGVRAIASFQIPLPPPAEQAAIARLLDAVDTALERTRAAIARARELRRGLLQAAFEFRNSREPTKDTDAGRIPRSWDAIKGKQAFVIVTGGCSSVDEIRRTREGEIPDAWFMKVDDFNAPENLRSITRTKIGFRAADNPDFKVLPLETIVIAKRGAAILKNRVRTTAAPIALDPNLMALQVLPRMRADFLKYQLEWRRLSRYCEDSGVPQLNNKDLYPRWFLRAPEDQQERIVAAIAAADRHHDALVVKASALETLKKSLMHDLLTGRVRVKL
jgi:hypothetical protein